MTHKIQQHLEKLIGAAEMSRGLSENIFELLRLRETVRRAEDAVAGKPNRIKRKTRPGRLFRQNGESRRMN